MFINMALLTLISNMLVADWQSYFNIFTAIIAGLSFTLFLQYLVQYLKPESSSDDKNLIKGFLAITGIRTLSVFIASLLPVAIGFPIYVVGIVLTFLMPFTFSKKMNLVPINFPHLLERISLLVIITFGEMIMGVADFFTPETVNLQSILYFLIVVNLFMYYFGEFDHAIDESVDSQGMHLIYSHYPIFIGLIMVTVSMTFLSEHDANHLFVTGFLYAGLALFQWAVLSNTVYNKNHLRYNKAYIGVQAALFLLALVSSLAFSHQLEVVLYITTAFVFAIEIHFLLFYQKQRKIQNVDQPDLQ